MKCYIIQRTKDGILLTCEALVKGQVVRTVPSGPFSIGDASKESKALALAIMNHYYDVYGPRGGLLLDPAAQAEASRKAIPFMDAFLLHHNLALNAKIEISDDVITRFFALVQQPVLS